MLHVATFNGNEEIVEFLISIKADINAIDTDGFNVLNYALSLPNFNIVRRLLQAGAQPALSNICMVAAYNGSTQYVIGYGVQDSTSARKAVARGLECFRVDEMIAHLHVRKIERARHFVIKAKNYTLFSLLSLGKKHRFTMSPKNLHCRSVSVISLHLVLNAGKYLRLNIFLEYIKEVGIIDAFGICSDADKTFQNPGEKCIFFFFANGKPNTSQVQQFSTVSCNILMVVMSPINTRKGIRGTEFGTGKFCKYWLYSGIHIHINAIHLYFIKIRKYWHISLKGHGFSLWANHFNFDGVEDLREKIPAKPLQSENHATLMAIN